MAKKKKKPSRARGTLEIMADEYPSDRIKHLEMIQAVVARLANEAALIRGWALTVSSAFFAFAAQSFSWRVAAVGLLPVIAFWGLNAYYLRKERQYRRLYNRVRKGDFEADRFAMDASGETADSWWRTMWSVTLAPFYGVIFMVGAVLILAGICKPLSCSAGLPDFLGNAFR